MTPRHQATLSQGTPSSPYSLQKTDLPALVCEYLIFCNDHEHVFFGYKDNTDPFYVPCTAPEYDLLWRFLRRPYEIIPYQDLITEPIFEYERDVPALARRINRVKKKLPPCLTLIGVPLQGYILQQASERQRRKQP